ncbi:hypothetical protein TRFO_17880 [Tritrichomonas foetus]|uniref:Uncharacterized protein n=1 Tax=Tritrichomonas foetus TaxID=1144522 RepID=A0A1J4KN28_9EUKA|nr:hypothetical protein TRFO_17880 [Tritrichomonas foetus]|eukprot:OHT12304.1 hypothetical protein TRFO_17880 [Tritrichomonas foetus]
MPTPEEFPDIGFVIDLTYAAIFEKDPAIFPPYAAIVCEFAIKFAMAYNIYDAPDQIDQFFYPIWWFTVKSRAAKKLRHMIYQYATQIHPEYQNFQNAISDQIREENQVYQ